MLDDVWQNKTVYIKGFWGWSPESWASIGFSGNRRDTLIKDTTDPFIMVIYVTENALDAQKEIKGKVVGFYLVSHQKGHRNEFTSPAHYSLLPNKWQNALKAIRAFTFAPEYQPNVYTFAPDLKNGAQGKASRGVKLGSDKIEILQSIPYIEVPIYDPIYGSVSQVNNGYICTSQNKVRGGPVNRSGYIVNGEPVETEKELYALMLNDGTNSFLDSSIDPSLTDYEIYKIGLSISPKIRLDSFQKSLPKTFPIKGKIEWILHRSTRQDGYNPYPNFEAAKAGEDAIKVYLSKNAKHLGGEFYAATGKQFEEAWKIGRDASLNYIAKQERQT